MFGRIQAFNTIPGVAGYIMVARGVFKETTRSRPTPGMGEGSSGRGRGGTLDEAGKQVIREALNAYLKPYLKA